MLRIESMSPDSLVNVLNITHTDKYKTGIKNKNQPINKNALIQGTSFAYYKMVKKEYVVLCTFYLRFPLLICNINTHYLFERIYKYSNTFISQGRELK